MKCYSCSMRLSKKNAIYLIVDQQKKIVCPACVDIEVKTFKFKRRGVSNRRLKRTN